MNKLHYRPEISGLRALSISFVLAYHFFPSYLKSGFIGVDIFFVISGYLIFQVLSKNNYAISPATFIKGRVLRLFPALLLTLFFTLLAGWFILLGEEYADLSKSILASLIAQSNYFEFSKSGYFENSINIRPLLHLWSLAVEFQFYIFIGLLIFVLQKKPFIILCMLIAFTLASLALDLGFTYRYPTATFFFTPFRLWEFLVGAIAALLQKDKEYSPALNYLGVVLLILGLSLIDNESAHPGLITLLPVLAAALLLVKTRSNIVTSILSTTPLTNLGIISYALYLWHWPLLEYSKLIWGGLSPLFRVGLLMLSLVLAYLTTFNFEKQVREGQRFTLLLVFTIVITVCAGLIISCHGLQTRSVHVKNQILNQNNPFAMTYRKSCEKYIKRHHKEDRCNDDRFIEGKTTLAVIGDSQANAFTTVLNAFDSSGKFHYLQLGMGMCPALIGYGDDDCRQFAKKTFQSITQRPAFNTLIIATQWPLYSDGIKINGHIYSADLFWQSFEETITAYSKHVKDIYIVYSVPLGAEPRRCFQRLPFEAQSCDLKRALVNQNEKHYRAQIEPFIQRYGLKVIDPVSSICIGERCPVLSDSKILYLDSSHLSESGGKFLLQHLDPQVLEKLYH